MQFKLVWSLRATNGRASKGSLEEPRTGHSTMAETGSISNAGKTQEKPFQVAAPALNLPKGGGAIHGIGEKFAANP